MNITVFTSNKIYRLKVVSSAAKNFFHVILDKKLAVRTLAKKFIITVYKKSGLSAIETAGRFIAQPTLPKIPKSIEKTAKSIVAKCIGETLTKAAKKLATAIGATPIFIAQICGNVITSPPLKIEFVTSSKGLTVGKRPFLFVASAEKSLPHATRAKNFARPNAACNPRFIKSCWRQNLQWAINFDIINPIRVSPQIIIEGVAHRGGSF